MIVLDHHKQKVDKIKIIDLGTAKIFSDDSKLKTMVGSDFFQGPEVSSGVYGPECDIYSIAMGLMLCIFSYWTSDELRRSHFAAEEEREHSSRIIWYNHWNYRDVYEPNSNPFVEEVLKLANEDPSLRPSVEEALQTFWDPPQPTNQQSHDFVHAADKLLKFKGLGFLRHKYNTVPGTDSQAQNQLDGANAEIEELKAKLEQRNLENARLKSFIKNYHEEGGRLLASDTDSGHDVPVAVTFESSDD